MPSLFIDAEYHGLDFGLVLALISTAPQAMKKVISPPQQSMLWLEAGQSFPNTLGQGNDLITAYVNSELTVDTMYDPTRVGIMDTNDNIIAEIINLAIPE